MAAVVKLFDGGILDKEKKEIDLNEPNYKGKVIGLYFSANWCPPCRGFTPTLIEFYKKHAEEKNLEIIFISSDRDKEAFEEYYKDMPWLALDFKQRQKKEELAKKYDIRGIPALILLDGDTGEIICTDARNQLQQKDSKGEHFPWKSNE